MVLSLLPMFNPQLVQNSEGKCLRLNISQGPQQCGWKVADRIRTQTYLYSYQFLVSKLLYMLVVLLITTNFSGFRFL